MSIIAQLLFAWVFAALQSGTPPAQFTITNHGPVFSGETHTTAQTRAR